MKESDRWLLASCWTFCRRFHISWKRRCCHRHWFGITEGSVDLGTMWVWEVSDELFLFLGSPDTMLGENYCAPTVHMCDHDDYRKQNIVFPLFSSKWFKLKVDDTLASWQGSCLAASNASSLQEGPRSRRLSFLAGEGLLVQVNPGGGKWVSSGSPCSQHSRKHVSCLMASYPRCLLSQSHCLPVAVWWMRSKLRWFIREAFQWKKIKNKPNCSPVGHHQGALVSKPSAAKDN